MSLKTLFYNKSVLKNLTCQIEESTIYGIIGVNGAGKTTLLNIISGKEQYDEGKISFNDEFSFKIIGSCQYDLVVTYGNEVEILEPEVECRFGH